VNEIVFKISVTIYNQIHSIEVPEDVTIDQYFELCRLMAGSLGYNEELIEAYFND